MLKHKALRLQIAEAAALAILFGTSAFAESRHLNGTRGGGSGHSFSHGSGFSRPSFGRSGGMAPRFESRNFGSRSFGSRSFGSRSFGSRSFGSRSESRSFGSRSFGSRGSAPRAPRSVAPAWHGGRSWGGNRGGAPFRGFNSGSRFFGRGRIDRFAACPGGYHVWLGGWGYPFFVPYRFWNPFRFRIGLFVGFNAFYDPLGYYNVYDPWYYPYPPPAVVVAPRPYYRDGGDYDDGNQYGSSVVRGTVQSVDERRDTMWINDETTHRVVEVLMPPDRQLNGVRAGDYVEVSGDWKGDGVFDAHALDRYEPRR
jgi:hypothetical protein